MVLWELLTLPDGLQTDQFVDRTFRESSFFFFFSIWVFFHEHSRFTGQQGKGEGIYLTPLYHFHPLHRRLDIGRAIAAGCSPLRIAGSRTRTFGLRAQVANHQATRPREPNWSLTEQLVKDCKPLMNQSLIVPANFTLKYN